MALSKNQKDIVNLAASGGTDKEFLVMQRIHEMEDTFDEKIATFKDSIKGDPGEDGHTPTDEELLNLIHPLIPEVEDGHTPTDEELLALIKPLIPKVKDGETPSDARLLSLIRPLMPPAVDEQKMMVEIEANLAEKLPALGQRIRDGLELLQPGEKLNPTAIEGWDEFEQSIRDGIAKAGKVGWGAHPLTVHSAGTPVDKNTRNINFTGAGVTSVTRDKNGVVTVNLAGGGGSGTVTNVASADGSITVTNPTTTADLALAPAAITGKTAVTAVGTDYILISDTSDAGNLKKALASDLAGAASVSWGGVTGTLSDQTDLQTALDAKQPLDSDLTTIAGLTATTDNFIQSKGSAWASRTIAQVKTDLGLSGTNSGDQTITLTGDATGTGTGSFATTVGKINGVSLAGLATGILKNTTTTGVPSIAIAADFPTLNQDTTGSAAKLTTARAIDGQNFDGSAAITVIAPGTHAATSKATPVDADELPLVDSAASNVLKKLTWANVKATLKTYFDGIYQAVGSYITASSVDVLTNKDLTSGTNTFPTFNQSTTGSAAKWTTARNLAGNSVDGSANVAFANKFLVQGTADAGLSGAQFMGALGTGIVKNTTTTGVQSIAVAGDFPTLNQNTTGTAAGLATGRTIAISGDLSYTSPSFDGTGNVTAAGTLATVNTNTGAWGSATQVGTFTVNGKGLITAAGNTTVTPAVGSITGLGTGVGTALGVNIGSAGAVVTSSSTDTLTNKTLTTPVINGTITGTGQATAATASTIMMRDANINSAVNNMVEGFATTATAAGTTALTVSSAYTQVFTGSSTQTVTLPTTSVLQGQQYLIVNQSTGLVTVQSSGANTIVILGASTSAFFTAVVATPTTAANWAFQYAGVNAASGKVATVNNNITFAGTDTTTMTFPSTSATIARTDAAQTFTGVQTVTSALNTTPQALSVTTNAATADISHGIQNFTNSSAATMTITLTTTSAVDGQMKIVRIYDASAVAQTISWVGTENSGVSAPTTSNGSATLPLSVCFQFNGSTSKWRCLAVS